MLNLTRRRGPDARQETWLIHYGNVRVGHIAERVGNPTGMPHWQRSCGFNRGNHPREWTGCTAASFEEARRTFEAAWQVFLGNAPRPISRNTGVTGEAMHGSALRGTPASRSGRPGRAASAGRRLALRTPSTTSLPRTWRARSVQSSLRSFT